jgi:hypothetical protein
VNSNGVIGPTVHLVVVREHKIVLLLSRHQPLTVVKFVVIKLNPKIVTLNHVLSTVKVHTDLGVLVIVVPRNKPKPLQLLLHHYMVELLVFLRLTLKIVVVMSIV